MTDRKPKQKSKNPVLSLTPEQQAAAAAEVLEHKAQRAAEAKLREYNLALYSKRVDKMTQRQLQGELRSIVRKEHGAPGLTAAFGVALGIVLKNTKTPENPFAKLGSYPQ